MAITGAVNVAALSGGFVALVVVLILLVVIFLLVVTITKEKKSKRIYLRHIKCIILYLVFMIWQAMKFQ